jgi:hypothetical protein
MHGPQTQHTGDRRIPPAGARSGQHHPGYLWPPDTRNAGTDRHAHRQARSAREYCTRITHRTKGPDPYLADMALKSERPHPWGSFWWAV